MMRVLEEEKISGSYRKAVKGSVIVILRSLFFPYIALIVFLYLLI